ncbi:MAG: HetP family heterocyst commitment protein [Cyanobacteria bacterium P01_C01_bin.118]
MFNTEQMKASMSEEDFALIIDAILNGKYSWACVLILKNAGYEPGHYIPYRTLNRLIKENGFPNCVSNRQPSNPKSRRGVNQKHSSVRDMRDLNFLELAANDSKEIKGGNFSAWGMLSSGISPMGRCSTAFP